MKKVNLIVSNNFTCAGEPTIITAKKGVQATDIQGSNFILWEQQRFPTGNSWLAISQVVMPPQPITGSISASGSYGTLGQVIFSNSNNVSFGMSGQTVTATVTFPAGGVGSISGGTTRGTLGEVIFSNSNGISFGMDGQTMTATVKTDYQSSGAYLTTAMLSNAVTISNINISAGTTSNNLSAFTFNNGNGVTFGLDGSTITASVAAGGGLTNINISAGTTSNLASAFTFSNSNGLAFGLDAGTITGSYTVPTVTNSSATISAGTQSTTLGSLVFSNSNGVGFGLSNNTITASYTVPTVTNSSATISAGTQSTTLGSLVFSDSNGLAFGLSNNTITGSYTVPSTAGLLSAINVSASGTSNNLSAIVFSNSNNFTFGMSGSTITASYTVPSVTNSSWTVSDAANSGRVDRLAFTNLNGITLSLSTGAGNSHTIVGSYTVPSTAGLISAINVSASTTSNNLTAITFSNANGITFGLDASTITASHNALTSQSNQALSGSNGSFTFQTATFGSLNGMHFYTTNGSIVGSYTVPSTAGLLEHINISAGTTSNNLSAFTFSDLNGVSFGLNGSVITASAAAAANIKLSAGASSALLSDVTFSNLNGVSFGLSGSTMTASVATSLTRIRVSAGVTSQLLSAITFADSNGISFGMNGSTMTGSNAVTFSGGTETRGLNSIAFLDSNNMSFGLDVSTMTASAPVSFSAGTTNQNLTNIVFSNSNGVSFGLNGSTITASVVSAPVPNRGYMEIADGGRMTTCALLNNATYSNRVIFIPFVMKEGGSLSVNTVRIFASRTGGTILLATMGVAFYTQANSTSLNLLFSTTHVFSVQSSVSWSGIRGFDFTNMGANVLTAGEWVMGFYNSAAATNSIGLNLMGGDNFVLAGFVNTGTNQTAATASNSRIAPFWGVWNATTAAFPAAVAASSISGGQPSANSPDVYAVIQE